jgi:hypothetical protein
MGPSAVCRVHIVCVQRPGTSRSSTNALSHSSPTLAAEHWFSGGMSARAGRLSVTEASTVRAEKILKKLMFTSPGLGRAELAS